jgi:putative MATE family efflux protein
MILMGGFGPAAVTAVGLGDVWDRVVLRIGLGLGAGSITLISQETGAESRSSNHSSDTVLTQVLVTGAVAGLPFILLGWLIPEKLIGLLGPAPNVILLSAQYLQIVFSSAPFRIMTLISSRALQGTGDTRTPMVVGVGGNAVNIGLSIALVTGFGPFPELGVPGVGWGTALANFLSAVAYVVIFLLPISGLSLRFPRKGWDLTITKQLFQVSIPRILHGGYQSLIAFPFNALILVFGTEAAAAYHITRRIQQQVMAPFLRSYHTVTTIMVGQRLGEGQDEESTKAGRAMLWLSVGTVGTVAAVLIGLAPQAARIFTQEPTTIAHAVGFLRALSLGAPIFATYMVMSGVLTGAGDTRTAFYAALTSQSTFMLGLSYLLSVSLGWGVLGIYIGLVVDYVGRTLWVAHRFVSGIWITEAEELIEERRAANSQEST